MPCVWWQAEILTGCVGSLESPHTTWEQCAVWPPVPWIHFWKDVNSFPLSLPIQHIVCPSNCVSWYLSVNHFPSHCQYRTLAWWCMACGCWNMLMYFFPKALNSRGKGTRASSIEVSSLCEMVLGVDRIWCPVVEECRSSFCNAHLAH